jgi:integrase
MGKPTKRGRWHSKWEGGRTWLSADRRVTYWIERQLNGVRFTFNTGASTYKVAMQHLARFEADPQGYRPEGEPRRAPVYLTNDLAADFLRAQKAKGRSPKWIAAQRLYLAWWMERLRQVDLRRATLQDHILPALRDATCQAHRIAMVKVLYSWLRKERHDLTAAEDPTYGALKVPQATPAQFTRVKAIPADHIRLALEHLASDRWRDLLRVLSGTGMHVSELERFTVAGTLEPLPRDGRAEGAAGVIVIPMTKAGEMLRVPVSAEVLEAARRALEAGPFDRQKFSKALHSACAAAGIPPFGPGRLRHTVATAAVNAGADPAQVASFLGHKSPRTTRRFYATHAVPVKVPTLA